ncbi:sensor histidine kinase [Actinorugispora endophytica]|uniref:histidine kinase n=1 Tax=Actinorugispora endophytica TaxID=1605990 RepID=A0A4R6ULG0_9ACTN|nr:sensor histidine kinase [Actinorugispora endophytica]TDQ46349.1 signal transduction histidine kinase [Actinorugispora endophytica]
MVVQDYRAKRLRLLSWCLALATTAVLGLLLLPLFLLAGVLSLLWIGLPLLAGVTHLTRRFADYHRRVLGQWLPSPVPAPYRPLPRGVIPAVGTILRDPATWRDLAWLVLNPLLGLVLLLLPVVLFVLGVNSLLVPLYWPLMPPDTLVVFGAVPVSSQAGSYFTLLQAPVAFLAFWLATPPLMRVYAHLNRFLLAPNAAARLTARVAHLSASRDDAVDTQASEVRRIERDLHDGAQARLVALGMSLGMAEQMLATDPAAAQRLLTEARESTRQALTELRDLVRGIHPPVLVERGLDGAVRALAVTQQLPISVDIDLAGRPEDPVESAVYFAVAELLTNTAKHAHATRAWVRINYGLGRMVIVVGDDGNGGADTANGSGLTGVRRRLGAFDGTMMIASPPGGPTIITMELPCALSSPKTSPSSATG